MPALIRIAVLVLLYLTANAPVLAAPATKAEDALTPVMAGEFALQAGQLDEAARWYLQAAREDAGIVAQRDARAVVRPRA